MHDLTARLIGPLDTPRRLGTYRQPITVGPYVKDCAAHSVSPAVVCLDATGLVTGDLIRPHQSSALHREDEVDNPVALDADGGVAEQDVW